MFDEESDKMMKWFYDETSDGKVHVSTEYSDYHMEYLVYIGQFTYVNVSSARTTLIYICTRTLLSKRISNVLLPTRS